MGYNKIPLALRYNDTTNNAEGLIEFQLNLSDVGDVCGDEPGAGQALVYRADGDWCPSTLPAPGAFNGNLSDVGQVCDNQPTNGQALVWSSNIWCPSTIQTGGGGSTETVYFEVQNDSGADILAGQAVFVSGFVGDNARVGLAQANSTTTMPAIGIAHTTILNGTTGLITSLGEVRGGTYDGTPTAGEVLYVSPNTAGRVTSTKPIGGSELIQNVGVMVRSSGIPIIKATITSRTNDIPNNLDVVGSVTVGDTVISQTDAKLANVDANHVLISTATSATSSITSATLFSQGITDNNIVTSVNSQTGPSVSLNTGDITEVANSRYVTDAQEAQVDFLNLGSQLTLNTTPLNLNSIPAGNLQDTYLTSLAGVNPSDLDTGTSVSDGQLVKRVDGSNFTGVTTTGNSEAFLGTQANLSNLTDVSAEAASTGQSLVFSGEANAWIASTVGTGSFGFVDGPTVSSTFSTIEVDDIKVNRLGPSRPTCITHFSDWLSLDVRNNGYSPSLAGGASHVQDSNLVTMNTTEYGIGVLRLKTSTSVTNSQSRVMTYDSTVAPSTCGVSFAARVCPSGAWTTGVNEGVITMGIHNRSNSSNLHPNAGAWFQYDHSSSNWQAITGWFTVSSNTDTGISATPESFQVLQIKIDENWQTFDFYIDGSSVATHLISTHNVPTSSRYGFTFSVRNGGLAGPGTFTNGGNELFLDWDYRKVTHTATDRGESYIQ